MMAGWLNNSVAAQQEPKTYSYSSLLPESRLSTARLHHPVCCEGSWTKSQHSCNTGPTSITHHSVSQRSHSPSNTIYKH